MIISKIYKITENLGQVTSNWIHVPPVLLFETVTANIK